MGGGLPVDQKPPPRVLSPSAPWALRAPCIPVPASLSIWNCSPGARGPTPVPMGPQGHRPPSPPESPWQSTQSMGACTQETCSPPASSLVTLSLGCLLWKGGLPHKPAKQDCPKVSVWHLVHGGPSQFRPPCLLSRHPRVVLSQSWHGEREVRRGQACPRWPDLISIQEPTFSRAPGLPGCPEPTAPLRNASGAHTSVCPFCRYGHRGRRAHVGTWQAGARPRPWDESFPLSFHSFAHSFPRIPPLQCSP